VISLFGIDGAGKTSFLRALTGEFEVTEYVPTIGLGQKRFTGDSYNLTIWDLGGHSKFRSVWRRFFADVYGFVFVVDASDSGRFAESMQVLESVRTHEMMEGKPFVVIANKVDRDGAVTGAKFREMCGLSEKVPVFETVAISSNGGKCHEGVTKGLAHLVAEIQRRHAELSEKVAKDVECQKEINRQEREEKRKQMIERKRNEENGDR
jgi:ADP-ribosylation factor-like protein 13B